MKVPAALGIGRIDQIAFVVRNLEMAVADYNRAGLGPWEIYTYGPHRCSHMTYKGEAHPYVMKLALHTHGSVMSELIETIEGPNCYEDHLDQHGEAFTTSATASPASIWKLPEWPHLAISCSRAGGDSDWMETVHTPILIPQVQPAMPSKQSSSREPCLNQSKSGEACSDTR